MNTLPGLLYFSFRYAFASRSTVSSVPSKCVVGHPAGLFSARQWLSSYRMSSASAKDDMTLSYRRHPAWHVSVIQSKHVLDHCGTGEQAVFRPGRSDELNGER